jgi:soluble lytic murein transglycosylase-like protein
MRTWVAPAAVSFILSLFSASFTRGQQPSNFTPTHRLSGVGLDRRGISEELLAVRTDLMIQSQTFAIMRDPLAVSGAERITGTRLRPIFQSAARQSGLPSTMLEAISYLESWGIANAESPAGPKGIMQISEATARRIGLKITRSTRYRVTETKVARTKKGKTVYRTVRRKTPYTTTVRDERLIPERAIPAAANYLARMEQHFGGRDWAIFAYHCGEGCVSDMLSLTREAGGTQNGQPTVPRMFFAGSPVHDRSLYAAVQRQMERDYSPTYWFRVMRAEQLLALYRSDPAAFRGLADAYRSRLMPAVRAPNRLAVWLKSDDLAFHSAEDLRLDQGKRLARAFDAPEFFGYRLRTTGRDAIGAANPQHPEYYLQAAPAAIGTLAYIAFETRRLYEAMKPSEPFQPLEVTSLVHALDDRTMAGGGESLGHCSGQVFDIATAGLPSGERECLKFVLADLGWEGYLGYTEESHGSAYLHIGCAPSARNFFTQIFQEALAEVPTAAAAVSAAR